MKEPQSRESLRTGAGEASFGEASEPMAELVITTEEEMVLRSAAKLLTLLATDMAWANREASPSNGLKEQQGRAESDTDRSPEQGAKSG